MQEGCDMLTGKIPVSDHLLSGMSYCAVDSEFSVNEFNMCNLNKLLVNIYHYIYHTVHFVCFYVKTLI